MSLNKTTFKPWDPPQLTWLITGASSGFGRCLSKIALEHGHRVIATSRDPYRNLETKDEIECLGGRWVRLDLDDHGCGRLIDNLEKEGTYIDVLYNNAGWAILGPTETFSEAQVRKQMETMFFGPYRLVRAVVPYMRERRRGMIVNISSGAALDGREGMSVYAASKAAMDGLMRVVSKEVAPFNIRTLTINLGTFATSFPDTCTFTDTPWPDDYSGSMAEKVVDSLRSGTIVRDGDPIKACQAIYDIVVGQNIGNGKESETLLPMGRDLAPVMHRAADAMKHSMEVFGDLCVNVYVDQ